MINQAGRQQGHRGVHIWNISYTMAILKLISSFWTLLCRRYKLPTTEKIGHCSEKASSSSWPDLSCCTVPRLLLALVYSFLWLPTLWAMRTVRSCLWSNANCQDQLFTSDVHRYWLPGPHVFGRSIGFSLWEGRLTVHTEPLAVELVHVSAFFIFFYGGP